MIVEFVDGPHRTTRGEWGTKICVRREIALFDALVIYNLDRSLKFLQRTFPTLR